jgi:hypothetical protein
MDDWGTLTLLLPKNPEMLATLAEQARPHAAEVQHIGCGERLLLRQDMHLTALKRLLNDSGGYTDATRKTLHENAHLLNGLPPEYVAALRDGGLLPLSARERRENLPYVLMGYRREADGQVVYLLPEGTVPHMHDELHAHVPAPPAAVFERRTPDEIRTELYNAWRRAFYVFAFPLAEDVRLKGEVLVVVVTESGAQDKLAFLLEHGEKIAQVTHDSLVAGTSGLPEKTLRFLRRNGIF